VLFRSKKTTTPASFNDDKKSERARIDYNRLPVTYIYIIIIGNSY